MNKEEIQDFLLKQLEILKAQHVKGLMKLKRVKELKGILENLKFDFNPIIDYKGAIYEKQSEIPKYYIYELICYIKLSGIGDWKFFLSPENIADPEYIVNILEEMGAWELVCLVNTDDICNYSIKQLVDAS